MKHNLDRLEQVDYIHPRIRKDLERLAKYLQRQAQGSLNSLTRVESILAKPTAK